MGEKLAIWDFSDGAACLGVVFKQLSEGSSNPQSPAAGLSVIDLGDGKFQASVNARLQPRELTQRYGYLLAFTSHQQVHSS